MKRPFFWKINGITSNLLIPISIIYTSISKFSYFIRRKYISDIPIISVGSPIIGGGGKTPVVIAIINFLITKNKKACVLTKGYKGSIRHPTIINNMHEVKEVGDEPLLISKIIDTFVSKKRREGLEKINSYKYDLIVLDDGYRDVSILNKINILVIDGNTKLYNNFLFPSGEMLGSISTNIKNSDAIVQLNQDKIPIKIQHAIRDSRKPNTPTNINYTFRHSNIKNRIAFCGIGVPEKFYSTLENKEIKFIKKITFKNHYYYSQNDVDYLLKISKKFEKYTLVTTAKDFVRFDDHNDPNKELRKVLDVLDMNIKFDNEDILLELI